MSGESAFTIVPSGDLYKCWEHAEIEEHKIGTLNENGYPHNIKASFYDWMTKSPFSINECRECIYLPNCAGGCSAVSYDKFGKYNEKGCFKVRGVVEKQVMRYLIKYMQKKWR